MNAGMKMLLMDNAQGDRGRSGGTRRTDGGRSTRYAGRETSLYDDGERTHGTYDRYEPENDGAEMRGRRQRRYDNGRFAPTRSSADYRYEYDNDDDEQPQSIYRRDAYMNGEREYPRRARRYEPDEPHMDKIGFERGVTSRDRGGEMSKERQNGHAMSDKRTAHAGGKMEPMDRETAEKWVRSMKSEDGTSGGHWTYEQTMQAMNQKGIVCDPVEFYAVMNMMYSDYAKVAKKLGINNVDFYVGLAKAFLDDEDAEDDKLARYYEYVVKK